MPPVQPPLSTGFIPHHTPRFQGIRSKAGVALSLLALAGSGGMTYKGGQSNADQRHMETIAQNSETFAKTLPNNDKALKADFLEFTDAICQTMGKTGNKTRDPIWQTVQAKTRMLLKDRDARDQAAQVISAARHVRYSHGDYTAKGMDAFVINWMGAIDFYAKTTTEQLAIDEASNQLLDMAYSLDLADRRDNMALGGGIALDLAALIALGVSLSPKKRESEPKPEPAPRPEVTSGPPPIPSLKELLEED